MKQLIFIFIVSFSFFACDCNPTKQQSSSPVVSTTKNYYEMPEIEEDSIYRIGDFLFKAKVGATFEFITKGQKPKTATKGDTLYSYKDVIMLGDREELVSQGVFKKFRFKSQFDDFKVEDIYKGTLAAPNFRTDPKAKYFGTAIKGDCAEIGVNFAGHYTIAEWGCGALCLKMAIIDRISGQIIYSQIPFSKVDGYSGANYKIDSRMLVINTEALSEDHNLEAGYKLFDCWRVPAVYEIKNGKLKKLE